MAREVVLQPFDTFEQLRVSFSDVRLDGETPSKTDVEFDFESEYGHPSIHFVSAIAWEALELKVQMTPPEPSQMPEPLSRIVGLREFRVLATVLCNKTKSRRAQSLKETEGGEWATAIRIRRDEVLDHVVVKVRVVSTTDSDEYFKGALLYESPPLDITIDHRLPPPVSQIRWQWENFSCSENERLKKNSQNLFYVESTHVPTVILNSGAPNLRAILEQKGTRGIRNAIRRLVESSIGCQIYFQLIVASLAAIKKDEDADQFVVDVGWKDSLARASLSEIFEGLVYEEAKERYAIEHSSPEQFSALLGKISAVAQRWGKLPGHFSSAANALSHDSGRGDAE